jgi:DNA polymerase-3 subunit beta
MQVNRTDLFTVLRELARVAPARPHLPILAYAIATATNGTLTLRATDLDTHLTAELPCDGDLPPTCLPLKPLAALAKPESRKDAGVVSIDLDGMVATVVVDGVTSKLACLPAEDFPAISPAEWTLAGVWAEKPLAEAIAHVLPAASGDFTRPHLCCVALIDGTAVTTDGHRLHAANLPAPTAEPILLPIPAATTLGRILTGGDSVVVVRADDRLKLRVRGYTLETKLVDAAFPPFEQVIPRQSAIHLTVDAARLGHALRRLTALSPDRGVRVTVNGAIELGLDDPERGEAKVTIAALENDHVGEDLVIGVNPAYVLDALGKTKRPVHLALGGCLDPLLLTHDDGRLAVVMPVRV